MYFKKWACNDFFDRGGGAFTLSFYNNEPSKNKHFLILLSSLARNSQKLRLKRIFEILWVLFEKCAILYFYWPKSRIWQTLEKGWRAKLESAYFLMVHYCKKIVWYRKNHLKGLLGKIYRIIMKVLKCTCIFKEIIAIKWHVMLLNILFVWNATFKQASIVCNLIRLWRGKYFS